MGSSSLRGYAAGALSSPRALAGGAALIGGAAFVLAVLTLMDLEPFSSSQLQGPGANRRPRLSARDGTVLATTYHQGWNALDRYQLHEFPAVLRAAFVEAEDRRFFNHHGVDWLARFHALWQNARNLRRVRGASTITEQLVRLLHPRPRTLWSRWLEGFEATMLEQRISKSEILERYLNQVPYGAGRRGVVQAARYYFDRTLNTLRVEELCALAVLVRAPSALDPYRHRGRISGALIRLGHRLVRAGRIDPGQWATARIRPLELVAPQPALEAPHFVRRVRTTVKTANRLLVTTLDPELQRTAQALLEGQLARLQERGVENGAALIADHQANEILAWAVATNDPNSASIDSVTEPRQPGSTLKPFVYALALEAGWQPSSVIQDTRLSRPVRDGLHQVHNYSRRHYGAVTIRTALGNSLNVPAVKALRVLGPATLLARLRSMGVESLSESASFYGDGLALGNGEISLLELVQAYATLARGGRYAPLQVRADTARVYRQVFSAHASATVAAMLSDPSTRRLEFGPSTALDMPVETAAKTGTSSDYRDAWALGFNHRFTVGIWMGDLERAPMSEVTGSAGPALILRALFASLNRRVESQPLAIRSSGALPCSMTRAQTRSIPRRRLIRLAATGQWTQAKRLGKVGTEAQRADLRRSAEGRMSARPRVPDLWFVRDMVQKNPPRASMSGE